MKLNEIVIKFLSYLKNDRGFTDETIKKYSSNLRILFNRMHITDLNQIKESVINKRLLDDFWNSIQAGKVFSESTRVSYLSSLKAFLKYLYEFEFIEEDISHKIVMPKPRMLYIEGLTNDEQKRLRAYIASHLKTETDLRNAALIMFLWATAARISEALALTCHPDSYIYFHDERIISGDFFTEEGKVYVHIRGKGKRDRKIIVSDDALAYLNLYLHERKKKNEIVFQNHQYARKWYGKRLLRNGAYGALKKVFDACEIKRDPGVMTHILRHTAINTWIEKGITDQQIITMTGHSSPVGLNIYHARNKKLTDIFGEKAKSTIDLNDKYLKKMEDLLKLRHSTKRMRV